MRKIINRISLWLVCLALIAVAGAVVYFTKSSAGSLDTTHQSVSPARMKSITGMLRLCTLEIYEETGIKDTINGKGLFAIERLRGEVSFDLEHLQIDTIASDSIVIHLPRERVELRESTAPGSYRVVDVWNIEHPLLGANLTTAEENALKHRSAERIKRLAYERGYVKRARANAIQSLRQLKALMPETYISVVDDTPEGSPN